MTAKRSLLTAGVLLCGLALSHDSLQAAQPPPSRQQAPAVPPATPPTNPQSEGDGYIYKPEGRRDPFVSLIGRGLDSSGAATRSDGLKSVAITEVSVTGIFKTGSEFVAMLHSPDSKTYLARTSDRLLDGAITAITADTVVFRQVINNPLSLVKQREVRKSLRAREEVP